MVSQQDLQQAVQGGRESAAKQQAKAAGMYAEPCCSQPRSQVRQCKVQVNFSMYGQLKSLICQVESSKKCYINITLSDQICTTE